MPPKELIACCPNLDAGTVRHLRQPWGSSQQEISAMRRVSLGVVISLGALLAACGRESGTASPVTPPGAPETAKTKTLEAGAVALQNKPPIEAINAYLDGFHFYNGHMGEQMEAHHY